MKRAATFLMVVVLVVVDVIALGAGILFGIAEHPAWFGLSIGAALAVAIAAYEYHRRVVAVERATQAARIRRIRAIGVVMLPDVRAMAAIPRYRRTLPPLPNLVCTPHVPATGLRRTTRVRGTS